MTHVMNGTVSSTKYSIQTESSSSDDPNINHCHGPVIANNTAQTKRTLLWASLLCFLFMICEIVGGVIAHSLAIVTDAAHLLTDLASFCISLLSVYLAGRPATKKLSFGWYRAEMLGALFSVFFIWLVTGFLVYFAVERVKTNNYEINATVMLATSAVGVIINVIIGFVLHKGHNHNQLSPSDQQTVDEEQALITQQTSYGSMVSTRQNQALPEVKVQQKNINIKAALIHVIGDLLQSVGVLIAAFVIYFKPQYKIADPICTFLFSFFVILSTASILKEIINVLMEGVPSNIKFSEVKEKLLTVPNVRDVHNLRLWSLTTSKFALAVHLAIDKDSNAIQIIKDASKAVTEEFGLMEVTVQVEEYEDTMEDCKQCQDPKD